MKHSKCLLVSGILGSLYLCYVVSYFMDGLATTTGIDQLGIGIATALVAPHMFLLALAVLFNWIGYFGNYRWAALTGGILYGVSAFTFLLYVLFEVPSIVLSFVGFAKLRDLPAPGGLAKARKCAYCGNPRESGDVFNRYGFCEDCSERTRSQIEGQLAKVRKIISQCTDATESSGASALAKQADDGIQILDELEKLRKKVPAFKSDTSKYHSALVEIKHKLTASQAIAPVPSTAPNPPVEPVTPVSPIVPNVDAPTLPKEWNGFELKHQYKVVNVAGVAFRDFDFNDLKLGDPVTLKQEPENEFDDKAIALYCHDVKIGYMHRTRLQEMANDWFEREHPICALIDNLNSEGKTIGLLMGYYQPADIEFDESDESEEQESWVLNLIGTNKKDEDGSSRQDALGCADNGDAVSLFYDDLSDTYIVSDGDGSEIGGIGKGDSQKLREKEETQELEAVISKITQGSGGRYKAKIEVSFKD